MPQNDLSLPARPKIIPVLTSLVLGLIAACLSLASIFALREIFLWALANLLIKPDAKSNADAVHFIDVANDCGTLIFALFCLGIIVVGSEHFFRHLGQPRLMRFLAGLIAIECVLVLPVALIFWRR